MSQSQQAPPENNPNPPEGSQQQQPPISWEGDKMFNIYVHDYCRKRGYHKTANEFQLEANLSDLKPPIDGVQGLLFEWWSVFWILFSSKNGSATNGNIASEDGFIYQQFQANQRNRQQAQQPGGLNRPIYPNGVNGVPRPGLPIGPGPNGAAQPQPTVNGIHPSGSGASAQQIPFGVAPGGHMNGIPSNSAATAPTHPGSLPGGAPTAPQLQAARTMASQRGLPPGQYPSPMVNYTQQQQQHHQQQAQSQPPQMQQHPGMQSQHQHQQPLSHPQPPQHPAQQHPPPSQHPQQQQQPPPQQPMSSHMQAGPSNMQRNMSVQQNGGNHPSPHSNPANTPTPQYNTLGTPRPGSRAGMDPSRASMLSHASPSINHRIAPGQQSRQQSGQFMPDTGRALPEEIEIAMKSLEGATPPVLQRLFAASNIPMKALTALTDDERNRMAIQFRNSQASGQMKLAGVPIMQGINMGAMQAPPANRAAMGPPPNPGPRGVKRNSTSPGDERDSKEQSPRDSKRNRPSPPGGGKEMATFPGGGPSNNGSIAPAPPLSNNNMRPPPQMNGMPPNMAQHMSMSMQPPPLGHMNPGMVNQPMNMHAAMPTHLNPLHVNNYKQQIAQQSMAQLYKGPGPSGAPQQEGSNMQQPFNGGGMMPNNGMQPNQGRPPSHLQIKQQGPMPPPSPAQSKPQNTSLNSHPNGAIKQEGVKQEGMNQQVPNASSSADGSHGSPQNTNSSNAGNGGQNNAANSGGGTTGHPNNGRATPASAPPFVTASPAARPPTTDHTVPRPPTAPVVESLQVPPILSGPPSENIFSADQFAMLGGLDTFPEDFNSFSDINFDRDFDQWLNKEP